MTERVCKWCLTPLPPTKRSAWCDRRCKDRQTAQEKRTGAPAGGYGAILSAKRRQAPAAPSVAPSGPLVVSVVSAVAAELALLADEGLAEGEVAWLATVLEGRATTLDAGPVLTLVPGLVTEFVRTYEQLVAVVEADDEPMPRVSAPPLVRIEASGPLVGGTLDRLADLGIDPAVDALAAVAVMVAGYLDAGNAGNAEAALSKALRLVMSRLRVAEVVDEVMAELLAPLERPGGVW